MVETHIPQLEGDLDPSVLSLLNYPTSTPHLNRFGLEIRNDDQGGSGRGVFATQKIAAQTVIEISPVLLFPPNEYQTYGKHTQLDGYTFVWKKTSQGSVMALALGLGSLFNHHTTCPNVNYLLDHTTHSIRYVTVREVLPGDQLYISYGVGRMWWEPPLSTLQLQQEEEEKESDPTVEFQTLASGVDLFSNQNDVQQLEKDSNVGGGSDTNTVSKTVSEDDSMYPPVYRITSAMDPRTIPLKTRPAWIVQIIPRHSSIAIKFLQKHTNVLQTRDDALYSIRHLRSFKTTTTTISDSQTINCSEILICLKEAIPNRSDLISLLSTAPDFIFGDPPNPYLNQVPCTPAPLRERLSEWSQIWPTIVRPNPSSDQHFLIDRQKDLSLWSDSLRLKWIDNRFQRLLSLATSTSSNIPSAVHVTLPFETVSNQSNWINRELSFDWSSTSTSSLPIGRSFLSNLIEIDAIDNRINSRNPLQHACIQAISLLSKDRQNHKDNNDNDYLLTNLIVFSLHEPCVYCTMALLHSRVLMVFYLFPSPGSGGTIQNKVKGTGGYSLHEQSGLNHSFQVYKYFPFQNPNSKIKNLTNTVSFVELQKKFLLHVDP